MKLSYVIVTYNRRDVLLSTLARLRTATPLARDRWETWVVDNASTDTTADAVALRHPEVQLIRNQRNEGMAGRNRAFAKARGEYVITLDDDSYPEESAFATDSWRGFSRA